MKDNFVKRFLNNRYIVAGVVLAAVIVLAAFLIAYGCVLINSDRVLGGVYMGRVDLSGCTRDEAAQLVYDSLQPGEDCEILFECEDTEFAITPAQIELTANAASVADKAYNIGRRGNVFSRIWDAYSARLFGAVLEAEYTVSDTRLSAVISENLADKVVDTTPYSVEIQKDSLLVRNGTDGKGVAEKDVAQRIFRDLADNGAIDSVIKLSITTIPAQPIVFDEFCSEYIRDARDATYTTTDGEYVFTPEVEGISFDTEQAKAIIQHNATSTEPYSIPAQITIPEVTVAQLQSRFAVDVLGTYTTNYASSDANRASNVALAAAKINGVVLNPGERFSFNGIVGPRTAAAGYKVAHVYEGDRVVDGLGGGICQVSSTLYNAVLLADLKIVYRTNHSMPVAYVPRGRDATVSYGAIDFIFENNKKHPVTITATTYNRNLTISVKGVDEGDGTTIEIYSENAGYTAFTTKETIDNSLAPGEKKVVKNGSNGSIYNTYKIYKKDGKTVKTVHIARSNYVPVAKVVAVGPAKTDTEKEPSQPVVQPVQPEQQPEQLQPEQTDTEQTPAEPEVAEPEQSEQLPEGGDVPVSAQPVNPDETSTSDEAPEQDVASDETEQTDGAVPEADVKNEEQTTVG